MTFKLILSLSLAQILLYSFLQGISFSTIIFPFIYPGIAECFVLNRDISLRTWCIVYGVFLLIQVSIKLIYQAITIIKKLTSDRLILVKQPTQLKMNEVEKKLNQANFCSRHDHFNKRFVFFSLYIYLT